MLLPGEDKSAGEELLNMQVVSVSRSYALRLTHQLDNHKCKPRGEACIQQATCRQHSYTILGIAWLVVCMVLLLGLHLGSQLVSACSDM